MKDKVLQYVREQRLLKAGDRVGVAVSGGPDSVALLRVLLELRAELGIVVAAVLHFNHKLRSAESDADEAFVRTLAENHGLEFISDSDDTAAAAAKTGEGIEATARRLRYEFFADVIRALERPASHNEPIVEVVATGHTLDDQAETVLMRLLRGSGTRGLAAILPKQRVDIHQGAEFGHIIRPLLQVRRSDVLAYLRTIAQDFREDASNRDKQFLRNRVRHELLPLLERDYNPQVATALAQTAEIARAEQQHWERELSEAMRPIIRWKMVPPDGTSFYTPLRDEGLEAAAEDERRERERLGPGRGVLIAVGPFTNLSIAMQRRLLQRMADSFEISPDFAQIEAVRALANRPSGSIDWPKGVVAIREGSELRLWLAAPGSASSDGYEYLVLTPGEVRIRELGTKFVIRKGAGLIVRNWRPGDRFHPRHSKSAKKVKELLTEKKITGRQRELWPVVVGPGGIVWLRGWGMASSDAVAAAGSDSLEIEEVVTAE